MTVPYVNPKWCKLAGLTPEEAFGAGWTRALHPEDRELISRAWYGEKVQQAYVTFEFRFQKPDGQVHWLYVQAVPFLNGDNQSAGYMGTVTDITKRKQAEAKIGEISQRLALATHAAQIGIWELDLIQDRIIWDDRTYAIYGVTPGDHDENFESWKRCLTSRRLAPRSARGSGCHRRRAGLPCRISHHPSRWADSLCGSPCRCQPQSGRGCPSG